MILIKNGLKIGRTSDFLLTSDFAFDIRLRWSPGTILVEIESDEKIGW